MVYYAAIIAVWGASWGMAQVAHLSLIPCLTSIDSSRVQGGIKLHMGAQII